MVTIIKKRLHIQMLTAIIEVKVSGKEYRFNEKESTPSMFRSPGGGWYFVTSPGIRSKEPVELTIRSYYNDNSHAAKLLLNQMYMGDGSGFLGLILEQIHFFSLVLMFAMFAGILYIIENTRKRLETQCGGSLLIQSEKHIGMTARIYLPQHTEGEECERRVLPDWRSQ